MSRRNTNRKYDLRRADFAYRTKFHWLKRCIYCGDPQQAWDHVLPLVVAARLNLFHPGVRRELKQGLNIVPACHECNALAGSNVFNLIRAKRRYIQEQLRKRYAKLLTIPVWERDSLLELEGRLRQKVRADLNRADRIWLRVHWPLVEDDQLSNAGQEARPAPASRAAA